MHDLPRSTAAPGCLQQIETWLETCKAYHKYCSNANTDLAWMPTRLVDCREPDADEDHVNVIATAGLEVTKPYITISHRWGDRNVPMLTTVMLKDKTCILVCTLPQSFQDAISIARKVGIQYVWIDCLCIVQDSAADFQYEASQMHKVFGNSYCNISATGAATNRQSLFCERDQNILWPKKVQVAWKWSTTTQYSLFKNFWELGVTNAPVSHRGWIVQERYLAPRVVHFGKEQIFFECTELRACEVFPARLPPAIETSARFKGGIMASKTLASAPERKRRALEAWTAILKSYSRSQLTRSSDKLIAIAGLANQVHEILKDDYLAGLWRSTLLTDLLWYALPDTSGSTSRPEAYRAPSWSWASVDGPLQFFEPQIQVNRCCTILDASVALRTSIDFGEVSAGNLRLQGHMARIEADEGLRFSNQSDPTVKINGFTVSDLIYAMDDLSSEEVTQAWCICLQHDLSEQTKRAGLVLKPVDGPRGVFARVGIFTLAGEANIRIFEATDALDPVSVPSESYHASTGKHTITVV